MGRVLRRWSIKSKWPDLSQKVTQSFLHPPFSMTNFVHIIYDIVSGSQDSDNSVSIMVFLSKFNAIYFGGGAERDPKS